MGNPIQLHNSSTVQNCYTEENDSNLGEEAEQIVDSIIKVGDLL
jgi:hypothetical protein